LLQFFDDEMPWPSAYAQLLEPFNSVFEKPNHTNYEEILKYCPKCEKDQEPEAIGEEDEEDEEYSSEEDE
jgi:hypothetical protein